jgi:hypothetical protein
MRTAEYSSVADPSKVKDGSGQRTAVRDGNWAVAMADLVAHLVSAYSLLEEIAWQHPQPSLAMDSHDLAFHGVCVALVALDECSTLAWSAPGESGRSGNDFETTAPWRDRVHRTLGLETRSVDSACTSNRSYRSYRSVPMMTGLS